MDTVRFLINKRVRTLSSIPIFVMCHIDFCNGLHSFDYQLGKFKGCKLFKILAARLVNRVLRNINAISCLSFNQIYIGYQFTHRIHVQNIVALLSMLSQLGSIMHLTELGSPFTRRMARNLRSRQEKLFCNTSCQSSKTYGDPHFSRHECPIMWR